VKATAWFQDEADARSACSLNNRPLGILGDGKLTVTLVQSVKIKISTTVYIASKSKIDKVSKVWKEQHLVFRIYQDSLHQYTTLKVEGNNAKDNSSAVK
jgi:formylmethanofuran dehydrogenase subunit E